MKKSNFKNIFLILLTILTVFLGYIPITTNVSTPRVLNSTVHKPSPAATRLNIGAWIIVAGDRNDHHLVERIKQGSDIAYFILASRDVSTSDIKYLGPDWVTQTTYFSTFQEDIATLANIEWAIKTWAASRVSSGQALGMYLFDHGGTNSMSIPGPNLADTDLNTWLDELETDTGCNRMVIIYEA